MSPERTGTGVTARWADLELFSYVYRPAAART